MAERKNEEPKLRKQNRLFLEAVKARGKPEYEEKIRLLVDHLTGGSGNVQENRRIADILRQRIDEAASDAEGIVHLQTLLRVQAQSAFDIARIFGSPQVGGSTPDTPPAVTDPPPISDSKGGPPAVARESPGNDSQSVHDMLRTAAERLNAETTTRADRPPASPQAQQARTPSGSNAGGNGQAAPASGGGGHGGHGGVKQPSIFAPKYKPVIGESLEEMTAAGISSSSAHALLRLFGRKTTRGENSNHAGEDARTEPKTSGEAKTGKKAA